MQNISTSRTLFVGIIFDLLIQHLICRSIIWSVDLTFDVDLAFYIDLTLSVIAKLSLNFNFNFGWISPNAKLIHPTGQEVNLT